MKKIILILTFVTSAFLLVSCSSIDRCMDAGGAWSDWGLSCVGTSADFVPLYKRAVPVFWAMVLFLSGLTTFLTYRVIRSNKP
jgi:hypothetical protein